MDRDDLAVRLALGALVGLGFVPSTVGAGLSVAGLTGEDAVVCGVLAGFVTFVWIVRTGERVG